MMAMNEAERMDWIQLEGFFKGRNKGAKKSVNQVTLKKNIEFKPMTTESSQRKLPLSSLISHN